MNSQDSRLRTNHTTYRESLAKVREIYNSFARENPRLTLLDSGCGFSCYLSFDEHCHVTGIDISPTQLEKNERLDERILADLEEVDLDGRQFDVVVCWDVLEHLRRPRRALERLFAAVAPGGLCVVASPDPASWKAAVARRTPHTFHRWLYQRFFGFAGEAEGPFIVHLRPDGGPETVLQVANDRGFECLHVGVYESEMQQHLRSRLRLGDGRLWDLIVALLRVISLNRLDPLSTDYMVVLRRPASDARALTTS